jgi:hypothetical protein
VLDIDPELMADLVAEREKANGTDKQRGSRERLYTPTELAEIPPPSYLLRPFIREGGLNLLYGKPASGKSFIALDWGLRIAAGLPWFDGGRPEPGTVIYNAAEGVAGIAKRIRAWESASGIEAPERFLTWPQAVNYYRGETAGFEEAVAGLEAPPRLIIVDTLARSMTGGDENAARDMGIFIEAAERVSSRFGAAMLVIHHTGKDGKAERGSSALKGAVDVSVECRLDGTNLELRSDKDKDNARFPTWRLSLTKAAESVAISPKSSVGQLAGTEAEILAIVSATFGTKWATPSEIRAASSLPKTSVYRALNGLVKRGLVEVDEIDDKAKRFRAVPNPEASHAVPNSPNGTAPNSPTGPSPLGLGRGTGGAE